MLTVTYIVLAIAGCVYVGASMLLGHLVGGADDAGVGPAAAEPSSYGIAGDGHGSAAAASPSAAAFHFPFLSPLALAALAGATGAIGLIALHGFGVSDRASLLIALPGAFVFAYAVTYVAWRLMVTSVGTSTISTADLIGARAEIVTPIPEGGLGEATALVRGQRYTAPAGDVGGGAVPRGVPVVIVRVVGSTLFVKRADAGLQGGSADA